MSEQKARCHKVNCPKGPAYEPVGVRCSRCFYDSGPCSCIPATDEEKREAGLLPTPAPPAAERGSAYTAEEADEIAGALESHGYAMDVARRGIDCYGGNVAERTAQTLRAYAAQERTIAELRAALSRRTAPAQGEESCDHCGAVVLPRQEPTLCESCVGVCDGDSCGDGHFRPSPTAAPSPEGEGHSSPMLCSWCAQTLDAWCKFQSSYDDLLRANATPPPAAPDVERVAGEIAGCSDCREVSELWQGPGMCEAHAAKIAAILTRAIAGKGEGR